MDANTVIQTISSVGFPIVMCLILAWYIKNTHEKLIEAIQNLTNAVAKLEVRLDQLEEKGDGIERISDEHYKKA